MSQTRVKYGANVTCYTQSPKMVSKTERYMFRSWDQEGELTENPMTLEKVTETHEYSPVFEHQWQCNFISPNGMVYANGVAADKPLWLRDEEVVHLKAVADANYAFDVWSDGYEENERDVTISEAMFLAATFVEVKEINISYPEGFIVDYPQQIKKGEDLHIVITEEEGNLLYYKALVDSEGNAYESTDITIHDVQKNMNFEMIWANPVIVELNGDNCTLLGMGTYKAYSDVDISCTPDEGYKFVQWSDGDTHATRTITIGEEDIHLVATCEESKGITIENKMETGTYSNARLLSYSFSPTEGGEYEPGTTIHCTLTYEVWSNTSMLVTTNRVDIQVDGTRVKSKNFQGVDKTFTGTIEYDYVVPDTLGHTITFHAGQVYGPKP